MSAGGLLSATIAVFPREVVVIAATTRRRGGEVVVITATLVYLTAKEVIFSREQALVTATQCHITANGPYFPWAFIELTAKVDENGGDVAV